MCFSVQTPWVPCYSLHGCQGWKLNHPGIERVRTSWNVLQRRVWHLPYRAHTNLLPEVTGFPDLKTQIIKRSQKFINSMIMSTNYMVKNVASISRLVPNTILNENEQYLMNLPPTNVVPDEIKRISHQIQELNGCIDGELVCGLDINQIKDILCFISTR